MRWRSAAWKAYAAVSVAILVAEVGRWEFDSVLEHASFAISIPGTGGVLAYAWDAFGRDRHDQVWWLAMLYLGWMAFIAAFTALPLTVEAETGAQAAGALFSIPLILLLGLFNWLALIRLSRGETVNYRPVRP